MPKENVKKKNKNSAANKNSDADKLPVMRSSQEVMQSMIRACCFSEAEVACKICQALRAKLAGLNEGGFKTPIEENALFMEQQQSQIITSQFPRIAKSGLKSESLAGTAPDFQSQQVRDTKSVLFPGGKAATESGASQEDAPIAQRDSQKIDDAPDSGDKNISLSYGLHDLIRDIEQSPNHHVVFDGLSQMQLRSLFAQITCKQTLIKEDKADNVPVALRLVRIEQELNDLMAKDEAAKEIGDRNSSTAHGTTASKRSNHDQG